MKPVKCDLPSEVKELKIEIFADLHIGSKKCDYNAIQDRIQKVKDNDDTYCILVGDLINNSTLTSIAATDLYESELSPMQQIQTAIRIFEPIKDKILGVVSGNHERRSMKDGLDLTLIFCNELRITDRYDYLSCLLFIRFGKVRKGRNICYSLFMTHGDGIGGKMIGSKASGLQKRGQIVNADIVVVGHTHSPLSFRDCCYEIDYANSSFYKKEQLFVNASATLNYEGYAEQIGMKPGSKVSPIIILNGSTKNARVIV